MSEPLTPARRRIVLGLAAVCATAAGAGFGIWRKSPVSSGATGNGVPLPSLDLPQDGDAQKAFWAGEFESPSGPALTTQAFRGAPLAVNFWATWCPPCVEELPLLNAFYAQPRARKFQLIGLAIDQPQAVRQFLLKRPLSFPVGIAGNAGLELCIGLGNALGGLPFSVLFGADGVLMHRKIGKLTQADLETWSLVS